MRFIYFLMLIIIVSNALIFLTGELMGINIYKQYGKAILKGFIQFILMILVVYIAIAIYGLSS